MPSGIYQHKPQQGFQKGHPILGGGFRGHKHTKVSIDLMSKKLKGKTSWNRGTKWIMPTSENHPAWKGDNASYAAKHMWVYKRLGKPNTCEHCGRSNLSGRMIHWANKSGKYIRDLNDWLRLCVSCHHKYDNERQPA